MYRQLIISIFFSLLFPIILLAESHKFYIGGPVRTGKYNFSEQASENHETSFSYSDEALSNNIGKELFFEYYYLSYGAAYRLIQYDFKGENAEIDEKLKLEFRIPTISYVFLGGNFLYDETESRFGLSLGKGQVFYSIVRTTSQQLAGPSQESSTFAEGEVLYREFFFDTIINSGWGYKLQYYLLTTNFSNQLFHGKKINASSKNLIKLTLLWRY